MNGKWVSYVNPALFALPGAALGMRMQGSVCLTTRIALAYHRQGTCL